MQNKWEYLDFFFKVKISCKNTETECLPKCPICCYVFVVVVVFASLHFTHLVYYFNTTAVVCYTVIIHHS